MAIRSIGAFCKVMPTRMLLFETVIKYGRLDGARHSSILLMQRQMVLVVEEVLVPTSPSVRGLSGVRMA